MSTLFSHVPATAQRNPTSMQLGLFGELGEVVDEYKKKMFKPGYDRPAKLPDELGDLAFYIVGTALAAADPKETEIILEKFQNTVERFDPKQNEPLVNTLTRMMKLVVVVSTNPLTHVPEGVFTDLITNWSRLVYNEGLDVEEIMTANRYKLEGGKHGWPVVSK